MHKSVRILFAPPRHFPSRLLLLLLSCPRHRSFLLLAARLGGAFRFA